MIYLTGDTHGDFRRIAQFCARMNTQPTDIMIILGDAGINFSGGWYDEHNKKFISKLPITLFCIHGNHERRPATIPSYREKEWHGGIVYVEEQFPSILFAKDGEVYNLNGLQAIAIGGAFSIDWMLRVPGQSWWPDEQPSDEVKARVEDKLDQLGWKVDVVLSHTVPLKYEPVEVFLPGIDQSKVDKTTEQWLDGVEDEVCRFVNLFKIDILCVQLHSVHAAANIYAYHVRYSAAMNGHSGSDSTPAASPLP